jgi:hypothetical protein
MNLFGVKHRAHFFLYKKEKKNLRTLEVKRGGDAAVTKKERILSKALPYEILFRKKEEISLV